MQHIKITFRIGTGADRELVLARLAHAGYEGFEETEEELLAYINDDLFNEPELEEIADRYALSYAKETVPVQNWNALWESNFEPVIVEDFCTIRAHFHDIEINTPYQILMTPKMSFGTGHHATTQQMMLLMKDTSFKGCRVLDFGTGTGVLAILAEMLGAKHVFAIDNDEWSVENAKENVVQNKCSNIVVAQGSLEDVPAMMYDVILANINRNILLQYMEGLYQKLNDEGTLLMSGLLAEDRDIIIKAAEQEGFKYVRGTEQGSWIALEFCKHKMN